MRKKVLFAIPYWKRGGAEKQFRYIIEAVSEQHDVDVLLFNEENIKNDNIKNIFYIDNDLFKEGNKIVKLMLRIKSYVGIKSFIEKKLTNYDIVIVHNKLLVPILPMLKSKCKKVIFSAREADKAFSKGMIKFILSKADMITCNSEITYELLKNVNKEIVHINNGVEIEKNMQFNKLYATKNIGVIANITKRKNVKLVIQALKYLPDDLKVNIAGKVVDNQYYEEIKNYIKENNLESKVNILNYVKNMDEFYDRNDFIILPSFYEGTSNVILESYARKKLILLSNIEENRKLISDKYKGLITFDPYFEKDLADKINKLIYLVSNQDNIVNNIVMENYNLVINEYSIENLQKKYTELVNDY